MNASQDVKKINHIAPTAIVNSASFAIVTPGYIDTFGFSSARFDVTLGALDIALTALKVQEADDHSTWTDVPGADFSVAPATLPSATDHNNAFSIAIPVNGLRKRYMKLIATIGTGATGGFLTCLVTLSNPLNAPYNATTRGFTQELTVVG